VKEWEESTGAISRCVSSVFMYTFSLQEHVSVRFILNNNLNLM